MNKRIALILVCISLTLLVINFRNKGKNQMKLRDVFSLELHEYASNPNDYPIRNPQIEVPVVSSNLGCNWFPGLHVGFEELEDCAYNISKKKLVRAELLKSALNSDDDVEIELAFMLMKSNLDLTNELRRNGQKERSFECYDFW